MSAKKLAKTAPADKLALYEALVATVPGVERKGDTVPYTSMNGNMFSFLGKDGVVALRLPAEAREAFLAKFKAHMREAYGIIMKEYVAVPDAVLADTKALKPYFEQSVAYARALKAKATTKKGAKKGKSAKKSTKKSLKHKTVGQP